jgi:hypothetical protein
MHFILIIIVIIIKWIFLCVSICRIAHTKKLKWLPKLKSQHSSRSTYECVTFSTSFWFASLSCTLKAPFEAAITFAYTFFIYFEEKFHFHFVNILFVSTSFSSLFLLLLVKATWTVNEVRWIGNKLCLQMTAFVHFIHILMHKK